MSSEALSDQSCVCKGASYDEVYPSGHDDPNTSHDERLPSANSPSAEEDKDVDVVVVRSEGGSGGDSNSSDVTYVDPPVQSVIGLDGLKEFILLPLWIVNDFNSTVKKKHFESLKEEYQIPVGIPIHLPFKSEKCYYEGVKGVGLYKQMFKAGLRFPLSALQRRLLQYLGLAVTQISLHA